MKILILGHGRHGKDTVAELISAKTGFTNKSSSRAALDLIVFPVIGHEYKSKDACFDDRINKRVLWYTLISNFNKNDPTRLCRTILETSNIYVGMRSKTEAEATKELFDLIIWVDASQRLPPEKEDSCSVTIEDATVVIDNNSDLATLDKNVCRLIKDQFVSRA